MGLFDKFKKSVRGQSATDGKEKTQADKKSAKVDNQKNQKSKKPESQKTRKPDNKIKSEKNIKKNTDQSQGVLVRPLITEKATDLGQFNKYMFEVEVDVNKIQIAKAIEDKYNVIPSKINIINNAGRKVRYGKNTGMTRAWKKAVITLPEGKTIKIHEGV